MRKFVINVNGNRYEVEVEEVGGGISTPAARSAAPAPIASPSVPQAAPVAAPAPAPAPTGSNAPAGSANITAPMPGNIISVSVKIGDTVNSGDVLCILEAMKMENEIMAPKAGKVVAINVSAGSSVNSGDILVSIA